MKPDLVIIPVLVAVALAEVACGAVIKPWRALGWPVTLAMAALVLSATFCLWAYIGMTMTEAELEAWRHLSGHSP